MRPVTLEGAKGPIAEMFERVSCSGLHALLLQSNKSSWCNWGHDISPGLPYLLAAGFEACEDGPDGTKGAVISSCARSSVG